MQPISEPPVRVPFNKTGRLPIDGQVLPAAMTTLVGDYLDLFSLLSAEQQTIIERLILECTNRRISEEKNIRRTLGKNTAQRYAQWGTLDPKIEVVMNLPAADAMTPNIVYLQPGTGEVMYSCIAPDGTLVEQQFLHALGERTNPALSKLTKQKPTADALAALFKILSERGHITARDSIAAQMEKIRKIQEATDEEPIHCSYLDNTLCFAVFVSTNTGFEIPGLSRALRGPDGRLPRDDEEMKSKLANPVTWEEISLAKKSPYPSYFLAIVGYSWSNLISACAVIPLSVLTLTLYLMHIKFMPKAFLTYYQDDGRLYSNVTVCSGSNESICNERICGDWPILPFPDSTRPNIRGAKRESDPYVLLPPAKNAEGVLVSPACFPLNPAEVGLTALLTTLVIIALIRLFALYTYKTCSEKPTRMAEQLMRKGEFPSYAIAVKKPGTFDSLTNGLCALFSRAPKRSAPRNDDEERLLDGHQMVSVPT